MFRKESMKHLEATGAAAWEPSDQGRRKSQTTFLTASGREASSQPLGRLAKQRTAGEAGKPVGWQLSAQGQAPVSKPPGYSQPSQGIQQSSS